MSLCLGALGFFECHRASVLTYKKTKELGFARNPRGEEAYACWKERIRLMSCLEPRVLLM
jgi:hypothetical protein